MKQEIRTTSKNVWRDVENNVKIASDDDALLNQTGKVGELKRYDLVLLSKWQLLTTLGCTISGLVSPSPSSKLLVE